MPKVNLDIPSAIDAKLEALCPPVLRGTGNARSRVLWAIDEVVGRNAIPKREEPTCTTND